MKNNYPQFYCINLESQPERWKPLEASFNAYGIPCKRVEATNVEHIAQQFTDEKIKLSKEVLAALDVIKEHYPDDFQKAFHNWMVGKNKYFEKAITFSHLKAIKQAYDDGCESAIICEDDIQIDFFANNLNFFNKCLENAPKDYGIINLYCTNPLVLEQYLKELSKNDVMFADWSNSSFGAVAYMISRKGMKDIIDSSFEEDSIKLRSDKETEFHVADWYLYSQTKSYVMIFPFFGVNLLLNNVNSGFTIQSCKSLLLGWEIRQAVWEKIQKANNSVDQDQ